VDTPSLLASALSINPLDTGDNRVALAMADIRDGLFLDSGAASINDFYESTIVGIGVNARSNLENVEIERSFVESFQRRRQEVSGVSLDEEVTFLLQFQRAFEASARVVTVTDRMLDSLLAMAR
jgi:flagellar hook-associated protein 1 FlgK